MKKVFSALFGLLSVSVFLVSSCFAKEPEHTILNEEQLLAEMHKIAIPLYRKGDDKRHCVGFDFLLLPNGNTAYMGAGHCVNFGHLADPSGNSILYKNKFPLGEDYFVATRKKPANEIELAKLSFAPLNVGESYYVFGQHSAADPISSLGIICLEYSGIVKNGNVNLYTFRVVSVSSPLIRFTPGVSGSPVLNKYGEVVAIGTAMNIADPLLIAAVPLFLMKEKILSLQ